jgi:hypothetical protein
MRFRFNTVSTTAIRHWLLILSGLLMLCAALPLKAETNYMQYDLYEVNGHSGYLSAWAINGPLDKVIVVVPGFDTQNTSRPIDDLKDDFAPFVAYMAPAGWDIVVMDYVDGTIDIRDNADNLARFIELVRYLARGEDYLAILSGSMGGIVARTMFVQEHSSMGVDTYVSIDAPHWGVYLSDWAGDLAAMAIDYKAAHQMYHGDPAYDELYGWLYAVESTESFKQNVNGPMNTCAIALSDGTQGYWKVDWADFLLHNKYFPVSSYIESSGLRSTYMPYHSTVYLDDYSTEKKSFWGRNEYQYRNLHSSYFDQTIANPADEHGAPFNTLVQGLIYIVQHGPEGS